MIRNLQIFQKNRIVFNGFGSADVAGKKMDEDQ